MIFYPYMSLGFVLIGITALGYISNWLNWHYLNHRLTHYLYYIGAFVHESSHAILCLVTGARIDEFKVFSSQPHVRHSVSKLPLVGEFFISSAPILGGLFFLFLINHFVLSDHFSVTTLTGQWGDLYTGPRSILSQIRPLEWQAWVMVVLSLNSGAMIGPSFQDLKNMWPVLILAFFIQSPTLEYLSIVALSLICVNIIIQLCFIGILKTYSLFRL